MALANLFRKNYKYELIDLSYNKIDNQILSLLKKGFPKYRKYICYGKFKGPKIEELNLMANFINGEALVELEYILKRINNLKKLNLTKNFIKSTDLKTIKSLNVLEELLLCRNLITNYIPEDFMLHLKSIDLSYN